MPRTQKKNLALVKVVRNFLKDLQSKMVSYKHLPLYPGLLKGPKEGKTWIRLYHKFTTRTTLNQTRGLEKNIKSQGKISRWAQTSFETAQQSWAGLQKSADCRGRADSFIQPGEHIQMKHQIAVFI